MYIAREDGVKRRGNKSDYNNYIFKIVIRYYQIK